MDIYSNGFNYLDLTVGALIVLLAIKGLLNGFEKELFGFVGLIGGVFTASRSAGAMASYIDAHIFHLENFAAMKLISFILILGLIWGGISLLGTFMSGFVSHSGIGIASRTGGFILAGVKYFLVLSLIVASLFRTPLVRDNIGKSATKSFHYPYLNMAGSKLINLTPIARMGVSADKPSRKVETEGRP
jgi:membrane protein required for colicin V production